jgi:hypothetical protein
MCLLAVLLGDAGSFVWHNGSRCQYFSIVFYRLLEKKF